MTRISGFAVVGSSCPHFLLVPAPQLERSVVWLIQSRGVSMLLHVLGLVDSGEPRFLWIVDGLILVSEAQPVGNNS